MKKKQQKAKKATKKKTLKKALPKKAVSKKVTPKSKKKAAAKKVTKKATKKKVATKKSPSKPSKKVSSKTPKIKSQTNVLGTKVPSLTVSLVQVGHPNKTANLAELTSSGITVLYFYPKDDTPGCTTEACDFTENLTSFSNVGAQIIGVSPDNEASHQKFIEKYNIPYALISDTNKALCQKLDLWKEKQFMGKTYMGVERTTFIIKDGFFVACWQPVNVPGHVAEVRQKVETLKV